MSELEISTTLNEEETLQFGEEFSERLRKGDIITFSGDLGSGKTEFIKGICQKMRVEEIVSSPTYTIINEYNGFMANNQPCVIFHLDLYRIKDIAELTEIGLDEILNDRNSIKLIEWSERAGSQIDFSYDINIFINDSDDSRRIEIKKSRST